MTLFPKDIYSANISPQTVEKNVSSSERKRRNIGAKSKRLLLDGHDSLELRLSWEEVQDLLRPPPSVEPTTVSVEDHEIEEFDVRRLFYLFPSFNVRRLYLKFSSCLCSLSGTACFWEEKYFRRSPIRVGRSFKFQYMISEVAKSSNKGKNKDGQVSNTMNAMDYIQA